MTKWKCQLHPLIENFSQAHKKIRISWELQFMEHDELASRAEQDGKPHSVKYNTIFASNLRNAQGKKKPGSFRWHSWLNSCLSLRKTENFCSLQRGSTYLLLFVNQEQSGVIAPIRRDIIQMREQMQSQFLIENGSYLLKSGCRHLCFFSDICSSSHS